MKSLEQRKAERKEDDRKRRENPAFDNAEFLRDGRSGENDPGRANSKGSTEGTEGDATGHRANAGNSVSKDAKGPGSTSATQGGYKGGNNAGTDKPQGDADVAAKRAADGQQKQGWGAPGTGNKAGETGGKVSSNPEK